MLYFLASMPDEAASSDVEADTGDASDVDSISEDRMSVTSFHSAETVLREDYFGTRPVGEAFLGLEDRDFSPLADDVMDTFSDDGFVNVGALDDPSEGYAS